jgi:hypothetical protein
MDKIKKLAFFEVGKGKLYSEFQCIFEQAQIEAKERNAEVTCILKIRVAPPETSDNRYGKISYETDMKTPPRKSMEFTTELIDGVVVNDGNSISDLLQLSLDLDIPKNVIPVRNMEVNQ